VVRFDEKKKKDRVISDDQRKEKEGASIPNRSARPRKKKVKKKTQAPSEGGQAG